MILQFGGDAIQQPAEVLFGGKWEIDDVDFLVEFRRDLEHRAHQQNGLVAVLEMERDVLQFPHHREVVPGEEGMEIFEQEDGGFDLFDHLVQRDQRILGGCAPIFLGLDRSAGRDDSGAVSPLVDFLLSFGGDLEDDALNPGFLPGGDVENRVACPNQGFDLPGKIHRCRSPFQAGFSWPGATATRSRISSAQGFSCLRMTAITGVRLCTNTLPSGRIKISVCSRMVCDDGGSASAPGVASKGSTGVGIGRQWFAPGGILRS
jgi:hypothetical protein